MDSKTSSKSSKRPSISTEKKHSKKSGHGVKKKKKSRKRSHCDKADPGKTSTSPEGEAAEPMSGVDSDASGQREPPASADQVKIEVAGCGMSTVSKNNPTPSQKSASSHVTNNQVSASRNISTSQAGSEVKTKSSSNAGLSVLRMRKATSTEKVRNSMSTMSVSSQEQPKASNSKSNTTNSSSAMQTAKPEAKNESLRWECSLSDSEQEEERIKTYKINRRKRYLAAANKNYAEWMASCAASPTSGSVNNDVIKHSHSGSDVTSLPFCAQSGTASLLVHHDRQVSVLQSPHISQNATQEIFLNC